MANDSVTNGADVQTLRDTVRQMDELSYRGFSQIAGLARLAIAALESPTGQEVGKDAAAAFRAVFETADLVENEINVVAERVGAHYTR
jgi:hypothetical protein